MNARKAVLPVLRTIHWIFLIVALVALIPAGPTFAQDADQAAGKAERDYNDLNASIEKLRTDLSSVAIKDKELEAKREQLEQLRTDALAAQNEVKQPLANAQAQLQKLGTAPEEGQANQLIDVVPYRWIEP